MAKSVNPIEGATSSPTDNLGRRLKKRLRDGEILIGSIIVEYAQPSLVKLFQHAGFDFIFLE